MNREIQMRNRRRTSSRRQNLRGGGYGMGAPLVPIPSGPGSDWNFAVKQPINQGFDDCLFPARPGELFNTPQPALPQTGWPTLGGAGGGTMSGGKRTRRRGRRGMRGGALGEEDLIVGRTFYEFDAAENEIIRHVIEHIEGDEVRSLKHNAPMPVSVIIEKADLIGAQKYDTQLQNLRSLHPDAVVMANNPFNLPNNNTEAMATVNAEPNEGEEPIMQWSNNVIVPQTGGAVDSIEATHAYRPNGWTQELSHGASPATAWGRDTGLIQTVMVGGGIDPIEATHAYPPNGWETPSLHGGMAPAWGPQTGLAQTGMVGGSIDDDDPVPSDARRLARAIEATITASEGEKKDRYRDFLQVMRTLTWPDIFASRPLLRELNRKMIEIETTFPGEFTDDIELVRLHFREHNPDFNTIIASVNGGALRRSRKHRGGGCGCSGSRLFGGSRRHSTRRRAGARKQKKQRGGSNYGYAIDPSVSIGGSGPNVDALRTGVPCDPRPGSIDSSNPQLPLDPRAYGVGYSATPNTTTPSLQAGGAYSTGNAFPDSCYKAPGSELPVYNAQTAGFNFYPSTAHNGALPDGITPYNDVVPYAARMGGARRRKSRKVRKGRKGRKGSRRH